MVHPFQFLQGGTTPTGKGSMDGWFGQYPAAMTNQQFKILAAQDCHSCDKSCDLYGTFALIPYSQIIIFLKHYKNCSSLTKQPYSISIIGCFHVHLIHFSKTFLFLFVHDHGAYSSSNSSSSSTCNCSHNNCSSNTTHYSTSYSTDYRYWYNARTN